METNLKFGIIACLNDKGLYVEDGEKIKRARSYSSEHKEAAFGETIDAVYEYYEDLELRQEELYLITDFTASASGKCYGAMVIEWDGEDDRFDIRSLDGIEALQNLESFNGQLLSIDNAPDISGLLKCNKLKSVSIKHKKLTPAAKEVLETLKSRGVELDIIERPMDS